VDAELVVHGSDLRYIAGSGNPTLCRASPVGSVLVAASTSSKHVFGYRHLVEPITTAITDALARATENSPRERRHPAPALIKVIVLTCWFLDLAGWISVAGLHHGRRLASVPEAATGRRPPP
jgi:hypothetical protein